MAHNLLDKLQGKYKVIEEVLGTKLVGLEYEPLFDSLKKQQEKKYYVAAADFVSTEEGTGIVHTAVMYGEDDYQLGQQLNLPKLLNNPPQTLYILCLIRNIRILLVQPEPNTLGQIFPLFFVLPHRLLALLVKLSNAVFFDLSFRF